MDLTTYIYLHGLAPGRDITLSDRVTLQPVMCRPQREWISHWASNHVEEGIVLIFLPDVTSQLRVLAPDPKELAITAWNSQWDALLLSAITGREVSFNFQSDTPANLLSDTSELRVTNRAFRGLNMEGPFAILDDEARWLEDNFHNARSLLAEEAFANAVHCLWSYRWHTLPRARLAVLWSGLEGLFAIDSELSFRLSLYVARLLEPHDPDARRLLFRSTRQLYKHRSAAVHGSNLKGNPTSNVEDTALLLRRLVRHCVEAGTIPDIETLSP